VADRSAAIRAELVSAQQDLIAVLDKVRSTDWERASPNEGWTVRDLLTHLSTSENGFVGTLRRMAAGEGGVPQDFDPNRWNAGQVRRNTDTPPAELRQRLEAAHIQMLETLDGLENEGQLDQRGWLSTGVEGSTDDCFRLVASHKRAHTADIRAALALAV
jgi:uncharacterized protein (TIGR03083 family)